MLERITAFGLPNFAMGILARNARNDSVVAETRADAAEGASDAVIRRVRAQGGAPGARSALPARFCAHLFGT